MTTDIRGVSTRSFFSRSTQSLGALRSEADRLQTQISTGQRLIRSSDDPVAASQLRTMARAAALTVSDKTNANRADSDLTLADKALTAMTDLVTRAQELASQAANGVLNTEQRAMIGKEMAELHKSLVGVANSRDSGGRSLFGGDSAGDAYVFDAASNAIYQGTTAAGEVEIGPGQTVTRSLTGPEFMKSGPAGAQIDLLATVKSLADALQTGSGDPATAARAALDPLQQGLQGLTTAQTVVGARLSWIELVDDRRETLGELRAEEQAAIGGTDIAETVARLQETMLVLEASQAGFARLSRLSLIDMLG